MINQTDLVIKNANEKTEEKENMFKSNEFSKENLFFELEKYLCTRKLELFNNLMLLSPCEPDYEELESAYSGALAELDCLCDQFGFLL